MSKYKYQKNQNCLINEYKKNQNFNPIIKNIHNVRYLWLKSEFRKLRKLKGKDYQIKIVDIGCGYCKAYKTLKEINENFDYIGIEPDKNFYSEAVKKYGKNKNFQVINDIAQNALKNISSSDIVISFECLEHIEQKHIPLIIDMICMLNPKIFACTVPVEVGPALLIKNFVTFILRYPRYKEYSLSETIWAGTYNLQKLPPHNQSHKSFDWRTLKNKISEKMIIKKLKKIPFQFLPSSITPSIGFLSIPKQNT